MWVITYKGKPATIEQLCKVEKITPNWLNATNEDSLIADIRKAGAIHSYLYFFGFTWRERVKGIECQKCGVMP